MLPPYTLNATTLLWVPPPALNNVLECASWLPPFWRLCSKSRVRTSDNTSTVHFSPPPDARTQREEAVVVRLGGLRPDLEEAHGEHRLEGCPPEPCQVRRGRLDYVYKTQTLCHGDKSGSPYA